MYYNNHCEKVGDDTDSLIIKNGKLVGYSMQYI